MAYPLSDEMKIIDLGWLSRSVTTSTVDSTLATAKILVTGASSRRQIEHVHYSISCWQMAPGNWPVCHHFNESAYASLCY